jgi:hypothetical protein
MDRCHLPNYPVIDDVVIVSQDIPDTGDLTPRNGRVARLDIVRDVPRCFGNDLDASLDRSRQMKYLR